MTKRWNFSSLSDSTFYIKAIELRDCEKNTNFMTYIKNDAKNSGFLLAFGSLQMFCIQTISLRVLFNDQKYQTRAHQMMGRASDSIDRESQTQAKRHSYFLR